MRLLGVLLLLLLPLSALAVETRGISIVAKDPKTGHVGEVRLYRKTFAVIVGIDRYQDLPQDKQLKNAVKDARGVEAVLRKNYRFDEIITLTDEEATKDRILEVLTEELPERMTKDDALFLFWAGHGNQEKSEFGELGYLIPYDGSIDKIRKNLTMTELRDTIGKKLPAKHVFYVMDACYSGLLATRSLDSKPKRDLAYLQEITRESVRQVLTAGGKGEEALDGGPKGHSVFTGRLIEALEAAGDFITANEIQTILREKVFQDARARNHTQTPGFGTLYGNGDFVFVPNAKEKAAEVAAEVARLEAEMSAYTVQEAAARQSQDEAARREAGRSKQVTESKLRAEKLRQGQLAIEARQQEAQLQEQQRLAATAQEQESELNTRRIEEEQRLAKLKAELAVKRQSSTVTQSATIEAAVNEIKRLSREIDSVEAAFSQEKSDGYKRIAARYATLLAEVRAQEQAAKGKALVHGEFETDAEFATRKQNAGSLYSQRRRELETQQQSELSVLRDKIDQESTTQTATLRSELLALSNKEFTLDPDTLALEVGRYDLVKEVFPFTLANKTSKSAPPVRVALNGTIRLSRDDAKVWKQQWENGFIRPQVTAKPDGQVISVALANDVSNDLLLTFEDGVFITVLEQRLRRLAGEFDLVKGGCFQMGNRELDEKPVHEVCMDDFYLGRYEVTQAQWLQVMGSNPSFFSGCGADCPVEKVSWNDVQDYLRKLNHQSMRNFRLPTEAEWEYAARSGGKREEYAGGDNVDAVAWYDKNSSNSTHQVGQKQANGVGLYDMSGNVWEWTSDWYEHYTESPKTNPQGPSEGSYRVYRGGSWGSGLTRLRAAARRRATPDDRSSNLGFRLAFPARQSAEGYREAAERACGGALTLDGSK